MSQCEHFENHKQFVTAEVPMTLGSSSSFSWRCPQGPGNGILFFNPLNFVLVSPQTNRETKTWVQVVEAQRRGRREIYEAWVNEWVMAVGTGGSTPLDSPGKTKQNALGDHHSREQGVGIYSPTPFSRVKVYFGGVQYMCVWTHTRAFTFLDWTCCLLAV